MLTSQLKIQFYRIAKRLKISMTRSTKEIIEFHEVDKEKAREFIKAIKEISSNTKVTELIANKQNLDINKFDLRDSKALYLIDDDYYRELLGQERTEQLSMF